MSTAEQQVEIEVRNPADGSVTGRVPPESSAAVAATVRELRLFQPEWEAIGPDRRAEWLFRLQDWLIDNSDEFTDVVQSETGKTRYDAEIEVPAAVNLIKYWARKAAKFLLDEHPAPHSPLGRTKRLVKAFRPHPVVGIITPWNFPLLNVCFDALPALMAGAAVLVKPSGVTPLSAVALARGWSEIGAPPVFAVTWYPASRARLRAVTGLMRMLDGRGKRKLPKFLGGNR